MVSVQDLTGLNGTFLLIVVVLVGGIVAGYLAGWLVRRVLTALGVPDAVEGTSFERSARSFGTSTVSLFGHLTAWFVYGAAVLVALNLADVYQTQAFWGRVTGFIPDLFVALVVLGAGFVIGDKAELVISERLKGVKLPEIGVLPRLVKYSIVYVAALVALGQVGIASLALLVLLAAYAVALIVFLAIAVKDLLASGAAGVFLLLNQPYSIGDRVAIGEREGVVQEVNVFVTYVEADSREYLVPNRQVLREGVTIVHD